MAGGSLPAAGDMPRRRPHPRLDQAKRTWFFFRRNRLALLGLSILVGFAIVAAYATTTNIDWYQMTKFCATNYGPSNNGSGYPGAYNNTSIQGCQAIVCTYEVTPPPNAQSYCGGASHWYKTPWVKVGGTPISYPGLLAPTVSLVPFDAGTMPLGALVTSSENSQPLYNISAGLLRGSDWSLMFSIGIVGMGAVIGMMVGAVAGFFGGIIDDALMRLVDIFLSIPTLLFVIVMVVIVSINVNTLWGLTPLQTHLFTLIISFALVWWPFYARLVRGQVLVTREQKFVEAARASGAGKGRILLRHIIPNSIYPIFIQFSLDVGTIPLLVGGLVFLGFAPVLFPGINTFPEWGFISATSVQDLPGFLQSCYLRPPGCEIPWWQLVFPGLVLFLYAISVNLLSDGLRDALDPRLRR